MRKQQNDSNIKRIEKLPHAGSHNLQIVIPGCIRVNESDAALRMIAGSIEVLIEAADRGWYNAEDAESLYTGLATWLVKVCDPNRECKPCKADTGLGLSAGRERADG
jgi:hypothetical protein